MEDKTNNLGQEEKKLIAIETRETKNAVCSKYLLERNTSLEAARANIAAISGYFYNNAKRIADGWQDTSKVTCTIEFLAGDYPTITVDKEEYVKCK